MSIKERGRENTCSTFINTQSCFVCKSQYVEKLATWCRFGSAGAFLAKTAAVMISLIMSVMAAFYWTCRAGGSSWKATLRTLQMEMLFFFQLNFCHNLLEVTDTVDATCWKLFYLVRLLSIAAKLKHIRITNHWLTLSRHVCDASWGKPSGGFPN